MFISETVSQRSQKGGRSCTNGMGMRKGRKRRDLTCLLLLQKEHKHQEAEAEVSLFSKWSHILLSLVLLFTDPTYPVLQGC